tara:strand:- start:332 stop:679 length:348 start_codon:yes stop_codon:yes gene_type:complete
MNVSNNENEILHWFRNLPQVDRIWWMQVFQAMINNENTQIRRVQENRIQSLITRIGHAEQYTNLPDNLYIQTSPTAPSDLFEVPIYNNFENNIVNYDNRNNYYNTNNNNNNYNNN